MDWLTDLVWCKKAREYNTKRTACAVINIPIDTDDTRSIGWQVNQSTIDKYVQRGIALQEWALHRRELGFASPIVGVTVAGVDDSYWVTMPPGPAPAGA